MDRGALELLEPEFESDPVRRTMFLHNEIVRLLDNAATDRRIGRLLADLEAFVTGQELAVSMVPHEHKTAYLGLLSPKHEASWEIRSRDPHPGMRVLAALLTQDAFVALGWNLRSVPDQRWPEKQPLGDRNSPQYQYAQIDVIDKWNEIVPGFEPLAGSHVSDFLSEKYNQV